jgi:hypothetical protein
MRLLVALLSLLLPPLALTLGRSRLAVAASVLWVGALLVFFTLAWGPGVLLAGLAGLLAAAAALSSKRSPA